MTQNDWIRLDLPGTPRYLSVLGACIREMLSQVEMRDSEMMIYGTQLAIHEGCINVIDHAYAGDEGRIEITLSLLGQPPRLVCEIQDTGAHSFDPTAVPEPSEDDVRGRGLLLIRQLMDRVEYDSGAGQTWQSIAGGPWEVIAETDRLAELNGHCWRMVKQF